MPRLQMALLLSASLLPSFILTFREAMEAALVIAIVASYLARTGREKLNRYLYLGAFAAVGASLLLGTAVSSIYGQLSGPSTEIFEGLASILATVVLTYMILWMTRHARTIRAELESKVEVAVTAGQMIGIVALAFVTVLREGLETVLFLTVLLLIDSSGTIVGAVVASVLVVMMAVFLMRRAYRLNLRKFLQVTSIVLIVFAAGLAGYGVHEVIEAGEGYGVDFGILGQHAFDINPPRNTDGTYPLLHEKGIVGSLLAALVGFDGNPEWLRVLVYVGYWLVLGVYVVPAHRHVTRPQ